MASVLAGARVGEHLTGCVGQGQRVIQLAIGSNPASEMITEHEIGASIDG